MNDEQNNVSTNASTKKCFVDKMIECSKKFQQWRYEHPMLTLVLGIAMLSVLKYKVEE